LNSKWADIEELHVELMTNSDQAPKRYEDLYQSVENQYELIVVSILEKVDAEQKTPQYIKPLEMEKFAVNFKNSKTL
jgi:hypothetical protein